VNERTSARSRKSAGPRKSASPLAWLGGLLALYLAVPLVAFAVRLGASTNRGFDAAGLWGSLRTSVLAATIATGVIAMCGIPLAHWLARSSSRFAAAVGVAVQLPLALPPVMSGVVLIYLVGPYTTIGRIFDGRLTDSIAGIVLAQTFVAAPFAIIAARSGFGAVDPALEDLAATLGHRPLDRFWRVSLPAAAPTIRAGLLLTWLRALGEYGATVLLAYHPYSLPVFTYVQFSGSGIPSTQAPTALALAAAAGALVLSRLRRPARLRPAAAIPRPQAPEPTEPTKIGFDLDVTVGTFRLKLAHQATSHRIAILGPSGSGKSMTLRSLAGLLGPHVGTVVYNGQPVTGVPTEERCVGYVPQGAGLFPGRTVWQQLCFATEADEQLAAWWLAVLHLEELAGRLPGELSGGQRQRVGLAQALAHRPRLVLLDEPFSGLDAPVRHELRAELRRLQQENGLSTVLVTHDPEEAALLADEILVIDDGSLLQAGSRASVYSRPASAHVARLLGIQNLNPARAFGPNAIEVGGVRIEVTDHDLAIGSPVLWSIRSDRIALHGHGAHTAVVKDLADIGTMTTLTVTLADGLDLHVRTTEPVALAPGQQCRLDLEAADISVWPQTVGPQ
jgi:molybdate transport system ATP-binding protein/molybdate transport system permease protein